MLFGHRLSPTIMMAVLSIQCWRHFHNNEFIASYLGSCCRRMASQVLMIGSQLSNLCFLMAWNWAENHWMSQSGPQVLSIIALQQLATVSFSESISVISPPSHSFFCHQATASVQVNFDPSSYLAAFSLNECQWSQVFSILQHFEHAGHLFCHVLSLEI